MISIGKNRLEGIDWVQEQLDFVARPLAERTYFALESRGFIVETMTDIELTKRMSSGEIMQAAKEEEITRDNRTRNKAQMTRRHNTPTTKRNRSIIHQGNSIDCADDDIFK